MAMTEDDHMHASRLEPAGSGQATPLGRIQLKQVRLNRLNRAEVPSPHEAYDESNDLPRDDAAADAEQSSPGLDPGAMERLVGYLDLFDRLTDDELSRLSAVDAVLVHRVRHQIEDVREQLGAYSDLLPRLSNDELARLTDSELAVVRFWRLSQPWGSAAWRTAEGSDLRQVPEDDALDPTDVQEAFEEGEFVDPTVVAPELRAVVGPPPRGRAYAVGREGERMVPFELEDDGYEFAPEE